MARIASLLLKGRQTIVKRAVWAMAAKYLRRGVIER